MKLVVQSVRVPGPAVTSPYFARVLRGEARIHQHSAPSLGAADETRQQESRALRAVKTFLP
jgi:hypothetical protein